MRGSFVLVLALALGLVSAEASAQSGMGNPYGSSSGSKSHVILSFKTMYGVNGPFLGGANPVRGVDGDAEAWFSKSIKGTLTSAGKLSINVKGLVLPDGTNDASEFRALVSCLAVTDTTVTESNVVTDGFPATAKGNAKIKARVSIPDPCVAPIVMILPGDEDVWFAMTGR